MRPKVRVLKIGEDVGQALGDSKYKNKSPQLALGGFVGELQFNLAHIVMSRRHYLLLP